jgi:hypothetical protein
MGKIISLAALKPSLRVEVGPPISTKAIVDGGVSLQFFIPEFGIRGRSTEPLVDACRIMRELGINPKRKIALFSPRAMEWRLRTTDDHAHQPERAL